MLFCSLTAGGTQAPLIVLALALESGKFISIWDWQWYKMLCGDIFLPSRQFEILRKRNRWNSQMLFWGQWFLESDYWVQYGESQADSWGAVSWPVWTHFCSTFSDIFFLKEFSETSSGQLNIKASALWARPNICWHLRVSHHALSVLSTEVLLKLFALPLKLFLCWDNPVCCRGGGFAFQKQFHVPKKSTR